MNKEILFKAKRIDNGQWVEGDLLRMNKRARDEMSYIVVQEAGRLVCRKVDTYTICQYTGLTDKNGNKIWENDIAELPVDHEPYKVEWDDRDAKFALSAKDDQCSFDNYDGDELVALGNVFDNPELLDQ